MTQLDHSSVSVERPWRSRIGFALLLTLLLLLAASKSVLYDTLDPDCFWHLRVAEQIERQGIHPLIDDISFSSIREPWTPYSWLAELGMKAVWDFGGYRAAIAAQAIIVALFFFFIALACVEFTRPPRPYLGIGVAVAFAAYLSLPYLSFRPVTAACLLLAMCAWLLLRDRRLNEASGEVWVVPLLLVLTANVHLFALIGPMWVAVLFVSAVIERGRINHWSERANYSRRVRRYALLLALSSAACLATPMLPGMLATAVHYTFGDPMVRAGTMAELTPFYSGPLWYVTGFILLVAIIAIVRNRMNLRIGECVLLAIATIGLFRMGRLAPLFAILGAPMLAASLPNLRGRLLARPIVWAMLATALGLGAFRIVKTFPSADVPMAQWVNRHGPDTPGYPCSAAEFVANSIPVRNGKLINDFNWGGYLAWQLGPRFQVFMDARTQLYSNDFWEQTCLSDDRAMEEVLRRVHADAAIVPLNSKRLAAALNSLGWKKVYKDDRAEVMVPPESAVADTKD